MKELVLQNSIWSLVLLPEWGGRVARLRAQGLDILTPITQHSFDPLAWPRGGIYPLMPYSNRVRDAQLNHAGVAHSLPAHPAALPHTLHGVAQTLPWQIEGQDRYSATLTCQYEGPHWPWPLRFEQRFSLVDEHLRIELGVTNLGNSSMPAGLGLHPYFHRYPKMRVQLNVTRAWDIDDQYLPTGAYQRRLAPVVIDDAVQHELALYGSGWDGLLLVEYPQGTLRMETGAPLTHFVAFAPQGAPYLCLEPVSHLADAFNSPPEAWGAQGTQVVEPSQTLKANLVFSWQPN
ncbi:aldose 1-epimerase [Pseudomonas monteilii]|uniref:aldose epimerase family protein n=1 Tax=Pseudomonas monteilii TaxID=76759 RepID=UPI0038252401